MPRYSDPWTANARPNIGLGHGRAGADPYAQPPPVTAWGTSTGAYGSGQQSWRDNSAGYGAYATPGRASSGYRDDAYFSQPTVPVGSRHGSSGYYKDYESVPQVPPVQYGQYNVAEPLGRPTNAYGEYAAGAYEQSAYNSYQPRSLFDTTVQYPRRRDGGSYFNEGRGQQRSYNAARTGGRPEKRRHDQFRQRQQNKSSPQKQNFRKNEDSRPKNGANNEAEDPEEKRQRLDSRFLFEKTDDVAGLFEKCSNLGEARHRQFRYKLFRCLDTLGLEFVTITEQAGTYAKNGTIRELHAWKYSLMGLDMKVTLKNFFPQIFNGEADGTEHENTCYKASIKLALKLHEFGLLSCETISNFYNKKLHYKTELFERAKDKFKLLIDEVAKQQFTAEFKTGKEESAEQTQQLLDCIKSVAEKIREQEKELEAKQAEAKPVEAEANQAEAKANPVESTEVKVESVDAQAEPVEAQAQPVESTEVKVEPVESMSAETGSVEKTEQGAETAEMPTVADSTSGAEQPMEAEPAVEATSK